MKNTHLFRFSECFKKQNLNLLVILSFFSLAVQAQVQTITLNTGSGPIGTSDPIWSVDPPGPVGPTSVPISNNVVSFGGDLGIMYSVNSCGRWISPSLNQNNNLVAAPPGDYIYSTTFNVSPTPCPLDSVILDIDFLGGDNSVDGLLINNTNYPIPSSNNQTSPITNMSIPIAVVPGLNTISVIVDNNGSTPTAFQFCGSINVYSGPDWHQFTKNAAQEDRINDITTDNNGNVYITGAFKGVTTLHGGSNPDILLYEMSPSNFSVFVAKYNPCGDLLWADHDYSPAYSEGTSIVLDENRDLVYITGDVAINTPLQFTTGASTTSGFTTSFVAAFDMASGNSIYVNKIETNVQYGPGQFETHANAITVNESNGDLYVGGAYYHNGNSFDSFVQKYAPSMSGIGILHSEINGFGSGHSEVNDLDFYEGTSPGQLAIIGDYRGYVRFIWENYTNPAISGSTPFNNAYMQGFFLLYEETNGSFNALKESATNCSGHATGKSVAFDDLTGKVYLTGNYIDDMSNPYNFNAGNIQVNVSPDKATYFMGYDVQNNSGWVKDLEAWNGKSNGMSVAAKNNRVYFTGDFMDDINVANNLGNFSFTGSNAKGYIVSFNTIGQYLWGNVTTDNGIGAHYPKGIAADNSNHVFVCGNFFGGMDYFNTSGSLPLNSSIGSMNGFVLRAENTTGQLRLSYDEDNDPGDETEDDNMDIYLRDIVVSPNPSHDGNIKVTLSNPLTGVVEVTNLHGKSIYKQTLHGKQTELHIDLSDQAAGVYFVHVLGSDLKPVKLILHK